MQEGIKPLGREKIALWILLAPSLIGLVFGTVGSIIATTGISLFQWDLISPAHWVGLQNFIDLVADAGFGEALRNTILFSAMYVPGVIVISLLVALLLNNKHRGIGIFRTLFFLPSITSAVAVSLIFSWLYARNNGLLNYMIGSMGGTPVNWLGSDMILYSVVIANIWGAVGEGMVIFLAGLQAIPKDYYEAATVDGAGGLAKFFNITLPLITPAIFFQTILSTINAFQAFEYIYMLTRRGGGDSTIPTIVFSVYREGFKWFNMGGASAQAIVLAVIITLLMLVYFRFEKKYVVYE